MKQKVISTFLLFVVAISSYGVGIDRSKIYNALSLGTLELIDQAIDQVENNEGSAAFLGALYMRKSAYLKGVKDKLDLFKKGMALLEKEISDHPTQTEYRFLRLCIQEHAPAMLGYNTYINEDKALVYKNFRALDPTLKNAILDYCLQSTVLDCKALGK